jgi:hypothetical protein
LVLVTNHLVGQALALDDHLELLPGLGAIDGKGYSHFAGRNQQLSRFKRNDPATESTNEFCLSRLKVYPVHMLQTLVLVSYSTDQMLGIPHGLRYRLLGVSAAGSTAASE